MDLARAGDEPTGDGAKVCPQCAEEVKAAARLCRFCGYQFEPVSAAPAPSDRVATPSEAGSSPVSGTPSASTTGKQGTKTIPIAIGAIALVIAMVAFVASGTLGAKHTMTGTISVAPVDALQKLKWLTDIGVRSGVLKDDVFCMTTDGYSDISGGTKVMIRDEAERVVGVGALNRGTLTLTFSGDTHCSFSFTVDGIPDAKFYTIEVGQRGKLTYSAEDLKAKDWSPALTLGG